MTYLTDSTPAAPISENERDDHYRGLLLRLNARWRIICAATDDQWIIQRYGGRRDGRPRWESLSFAATRSGLILAACERAGMVGPPQRAVLEALPEHYREFRALRIA
ncbi:hypothetical protein [Pikeienuella sp. HZG-20]|uniref:hypothetical protein n=1 Tax=Paludibacillus litoralis TaxID=3133267 RepID=UPI0030EE72DD